MRRTPMNAFVLDLADEKHQKFFNEVRKRLKEGNAFFDEIFLTKDKQHLAWVLREKKPGTCFDKPYVPWRQVRPGHVLWKEWLPDGLSLGGRRDWFAIRVTRKYDGVVFYRWLEGPDKGKLEHLEEGSLAADKMITPYIIRIPEDCRVVDCPCPKQIYGYVKPVV